MQAGLELVVGELWAVQLFPALTAWHGRNPRKVTGHFAWLILAQRGHANSCCVAGHSEDLNDGWSYSLRSFGWVSDFDLAM